LIYISGTTTAPFFVRIASASGVKGPFAASAIILAFTFGAFSPLITFSQAAGIKISHANSKASEDFL
jgi:hypothetical protein